MPSLLSGSLLRTGGSGEFIKLQDAMPQLQPSDTTATGFTVVTDSLLRTSYRSSLGYIEFTTASIYSALPEGTIRILSTGTAYASTSTSTGNLVVQGGVGIGRNLYVEDDIVVNGITIGRGYEGQNNLVMRGVAEDPLNDFNNGQENIVIGYDALGGLTTAYKTIAIGRYALHSGTDITNTIAIGDSALANLGLINAIVAASITGITTGSSLSITDISQASPAIATADHTLSTGTKIYITGVVGLTTITNTVTNEVVSLVNDQMFWVDAVTSSTLALYTNAALTNPLDSTFATVYSSSGTVTTPIILDAINHRLTSGTHVIIADVGGMVELNNQLVYVDAFTTGTLALYSDNILIVPVSGFGYTPYTSSGTVARLLARDSNIAIGNNAGTSLIDGEKNYFFGDQIAKNLTTGSYNFFAGNDVGHNITHGNGIIAIGGSNLVDGVDNQVNIGSVFYFNGNSFATINADTEIGVGQESTSSTSGAITVVGGAGISGNVYVGNELHVTNTSTLNAVHILSTLSSTSTTTGALQVAGGAGIQGSVYSSDGIVDENYLLYTPRVFITDNVPPVGPRIGDIWIDSSIPAYLQYVKENTSTFWIQVGAV